MSYKVHFLQEKKTEAKPEPEEKKESTVSSSSRMPWLKQAKKEILIQQLVQRKWTSKSASELQKYDVEKLRDKMYYCIKDYGTLQDRQALEECIGRDQVQQKEKRQDQMEKNRQRKGKMLEIGVKYFIPGAKVWLFDEKVTDRYGRMIRKLYPIQVKVVEAKNEGKWVTIEFLETRQWHEAGGHWVQKGQTMNFKFDPVTLTWLREGLTPEVVRSIGPSGKSKYFELSFTRQYLLLPSPGSSS